MKSNKKTDAPVRKINIRRLALDLLESYEEGERYVNLLLTSPAVRSLSDGELSALTALLYTSVERKLTYDYFIGALSGRSLDKVSSRVRNILRLGLCQILHMDSIPDFAAVNETVKLASHSGERAFVNAILRKAVAERSAMPYPKREKNSLRYLSVYYSIPLPLVRHFAELYGEKDTEKLLIAFSEEKKLSLTVNLKKTDRETLLNSLSHLEPERAEYSASGIVLGKKIPPAKIEGFGRGEFFVQNEASRIAGELLSVESGMTVIDVCAAPGGKSFAAAMRVGDGGRVYSFDIHESKLSLIRSGAERLGLDNIITIAARDATTPDESLFGTADRVICDVPCSGLGVLSGKPDIRYKDLEALDTLPPLQYSILEASAKYLKDGGILAYSTCTLNSKENREITDRFLVEHSDFQYAEAELSGLTVGEGGLTLLPHIHGTDGFFIALLKKRRV